MSQSPVRTSLLDDALAAFEAGRHAHAEQLFSAVLRREADHAVALQHLGLIALAQRSFPRALEFFARVLEIRPQDAGAHANYGNALAQSGQLHAAIAHFRQAVALDPSLAEAYCNLGLALSTAGSPDEAVHVLRQAVALRPRFVEALVNLGSALLAQSRFADALDAFNRALELRPDNAGALTGVAQSLADQGRLSQAIAAYERALAAAPEFTSAYVNLGGALLEAADPAGAVALYRAGLRRDPGSPALRSNLLFAMQYDPDCAEADILRESRAWEARCVPGAARVASTFTGHPDHPRLRVGLVSADFRAHPVGWFLRAVLPMLPADRFELHGYANQRGGDRLTDEIANACVAWRSIHGVGDDDVVRQIRADGIDILIDLSGHTSGNRLGVFARRAAPVQVSWLGYFATTGLTEMDVVLMDPMHTPPGAEAFFTERIERLHPVRFCYSAPPYAPEPAPLPPIAANGFVTFGGFHNAAKLNARVLDVWARILERTPHSRLVLRWKSFADLAMRDRLLAPFTARGVAPGRVLFYGAEPHDTLLALYREIDIALDPFPFSGATTTCEALWMGVPVLTWAGERPVSRQSAAILYAIGHDELSADSVEDYVERAVRLAADRDALTAYRRALRDDMRRSPLCDPVHFAREFGAALERIREARRDPGRV